MTDVDNNTEHQAVNRLFDLVRNGDVENLEFAQLDSMIYQRLLQAYDAGHESNATESIS